MGFVWVLPPLQARLYTNAVASDWMKIPLEEFASATIPWYVLAGSLDIGHVGYHFIDCRALGNVDDAL
jgi:hypothetical protein